jgi:ATP-binding protein involved in chromosome partitioning
MKKILITSLKGGTGKTTTSITLAIALRDSGFKVGILDIDYRTPNIPIAMAARGLKGTDISHSFDGDVLIPAVVAGIQVMSMAYIWPEDKAVQVSEADAMSDVNHLLSPGIISWEGLDYLVIDTPPTSVGVVEAAFKAEDVLGAFVVTHASKVSRMDAIRTLDLFREAQVLVLGMICNQVGLHDLTEEDLRRVSKEAGLPVCLAVPHNPALAELTPLFAQLVEVVVKEKGVILHKYHPEDGAWKSLLEVLEVI